MYKYTGITLFDAKIKKAKKKKTQNLLFWKW